MASRKHKWAHPTEHHYRCTVCGLHRVNVPDGAVWAATWHWDGIPVWRGATPACPDVDALARAVSAYTSAKRQSDYAEGSAPDERAKVGAALAAVMSLARREAVTPPEGQADVRPIPDNADIPSRYRERKKMSDKKQSKEMGRTDAPQSVDMAAIEEALVAGDLTNMTTGQRVAYYIQVCRSVGLNHMTRPFEYLRLNGRTILYATKNATDQLRAVRSVSISITSRTMSDGLAVVSAKATMPDGRHDESIGAVPIDGLRGEALANALMKAETKARRRVTLAICGLSVVDDSEVDSIATAERVAESTQSAPALSPAPNHTATAKALLASAQAAVHDAGTFAAWQADQAAMLATLPPERRAKCVEYVRSSLVREPDPADDYDRSL